MNVLMTYRLQAFNTEILPQLNRYQNDNVVFIVKNNYIKNLLPILIKRYKLDVKINILTVEELLEGKIDNMKFDYIVGNPPYQTVTGETTKLIWDKIIIKAYKLLKNGGEMNMLHPGGWRFADDNSKKNIREVRKIYNENNIDMELHDCVDGFEMFNSFTDFDIVKLYKEPRNRKTKIKTKNNEVTLDISKYGVLPTDRYDLFFSLVADKDEKHVQILNDYSYGSDDRFTHVSKIKNSLFKYPVVYGMPDYGINFLYSNTRDKGHFGIPKLIIAKAGYISLLDLKGEYGMTQYGFGLIDEPENLVRLQKAIENPKFKCLKNLFLGLGESNGRNAFTDNRGHMFKFLKEFRKDFWKEFYTPEMEQELINEGKLDEEGRYIG